MKAAAAQPWIGLFAEALAKRIAESAMAFPIPDGMMAT